MDVDIKEELQEFDWGYGARWAENKLIASSPFREDSRPSFFIDFEGEYAGVWGDSGATTSSESSGRFPALIAHLKGISYSEAEDYLLEKYGVLFEDQEDIRIPELGSRRRRKDVVIASETITKGVSSYMKSRGIEGNVQSLYGIGYNPKHYGFTAIPWHNHKGEVAAIKYRSTKGKNFFYEKGGMNVDRLIYGLHQVNEVFADTAVIVEGEIDAMSWTSVGVFGIALGNASINKYKLDLIRRSSIKNIGLGGDNDGKGRALNENLRKLLRRDFELFEIDYGKYKDSNEVLMKNGQEGLRKIYEDRRRISRISISL